jgi:hypothetical protein
MSDLLGDALSWFQRQQRTICAESVTYARGSDTVSINATVGRSDVFASEQEAGVEYTDDMRDFIIDVADLELSGTAIVPQRNDVITQDGLTWTVLPRADVCFRFADPQRTAYRVFTKAG